MTDFDIGSFMKDIVSGLATLSDSVQVIGAPVEVGEKIVIPAVVTRMGFGAGGGGGSVPSSSEEDERESGSGGGGAGGVTLTPVFLVVDEDGERLLSVSGPLDRACSMVEKAKEALDRAMPRKDASEEEVEEAFEDLEDETPGEGPVD